MLTLICRKCTNILGELLLLLPLGVIVELDAVDLLVDLSSRVTASLILHLLPMVLLAGLVAELVVRSRGPWVGSL